MMVMSNIYKWSFVICFLIATSTEVFSQKMVDTTFSFESKHVSTITPNAKVKRIFKSETEFKDYGLICASDTSELCAVKFIHDDVVWKIWTGSKWQDMFNDAGFPVQIVIEYQGITLIPKYFYEYGSEKELLFGFLEKDLTVDFSTSNGYQYVFSKKNGFVMMGMHQRTFLKRTDYQEGELRLVEL